VTKGFRRALRALCCGFLLLALIAAVACAVWPACWEHARRSNLAVYVLLLALCASIELLDLVGVAVDAYRRKREGAGRSGAPEAGELEDQLRDRR